MNSPVPTSSRGFSGADDLGVGGAVQFHARPICDVDLIDASGQVSGADQRWIVHQTHAALVHLPALGYPIAPGSIVAIRVVNDAEMSQAHERFSGIVGTTDVLTFDHGPGFSMGKATLLETDLLICVDEARRQADRRGLAVRHELLLYIVHGLLHCLGHDDHEDDAYARMHQLEDQLMLAIGLPTAFAAPEKCQGSEARSS